MPDVRNVGWVSCCAVSGESSLWIGRAAIFLFGFRFFFTDAVLSSSWLSMPGVARQPLTFFASPKKVSKERRPRRRCPFGVPVCAGQKMGSGRNSLPLQGAYPLASGYRNAGAEQCSAKPLLYLRHTHFFFHFLSRTNGICTVEHRAQPLWLNGVTH